MTHDPRYLHDLGIILGTAAVASMLSHRLRQTPVFGYLLAGLLLGPHASWWFGVGDAGLTRALSELGVILLMFCVGLGFHPRRIARIGPSAGLTALFEVGLMLSGGFLLGRALGWTGVESLFIGACVAVSSTMVVVKTYEEQRIAGEFADLAVAVLVFEDILAMLLLALLTAIAVGDGLSAYAFAAALGRLFGFLLVSMTVGMLVVPRLLRRVHRARRSESMLVAAAAVCFLLADLATSVGYSSALGAFIAGLLVAGSGEGAYVERLVRPSRDLFGALFFIAIGMSVDPTEVARHWAPVLGFTALVLVGKVASVALGAFLLGHGVQSSVRAGMSLAQNGEFSFIIAGLGVAAGAVRGPLFPVVVGVALLTSLLTPWMIRRSHAAAARFERWLPPALRILVALYEAWVRRLWSTKATTTVWRRVRGGAALLAVDAALMVAVLAVGSAFREEVAAACVGWSAGSEPLARVVWTMATIGAAGVFFVGILRRSAALARALVADALPIADADAPPGLGSTFRVILTGALDLTTLVVVGLPVVLVTQTLVPLGAGWTVLALGCAVLAYRAWQGLANLRGHVVVGVELVVQTLASQGGGGEVGESRTLAPDVHPAALDMRRIRLDEESAAPGHAVASFDLKARSGADILVIERPTAGVVLPSAHAKLEPGDTLTLLGTRGAIERAIELLRSGPPR